jgi:hypothetical protein
MKSKIRSFAELHEIMAKMTADAEVKPDPAPPNPDVPVAKIIVRVGEKKPADDCLNGQRMDSESPAPKPPK